MSSLLNEIKTTSLGLYFIQVYLHFSVQILLEKYTQIKSANFYCSIVSLDGAYIVNFDNTGYLYRNYNVMPYFIWKNLKANKIDNKHGHICIYHNYYSYKLKCRKLHQFTYMKLLKITF